MIQRQLQAVVNRWLFRGKIVILYGARQVGKTTLAKVLLREHGGDLNAYYNCEIPSVRQVLEQQEPELLRREFGAHRLIVLDEAQYIPDIGQILKVIADHLPEVQIIATGSSSFELAQRTGEPLTGRALTFTLYPFSYEELGQLHRPGERSGLLENWLRFGTYPEIVQASQEDTRFLLDDLTSRYLYKDIFVFENIRKADIVHQLLQLLAFQIGNEVSIHELALKLKVNERTVSRYIDLLEKAFVIFRLPALSRNLRKEVSKKKKVYFYDLGVRNSIIQQYQPLKGRADQGALWENFLVAERMKYLHARLRFPKQYFWRTHDHQELDYVEEADGQLHGYEFKWNPKKAKAPVAFAKAYPKAEVQVLHRQNFEPFLLD
jgi:predicted AAA+ superfamily ATPase